MRILITGSNGQLGWELCRQGKERGFDLVLLDLPEFDITKQDAVYSAVSQSNADLVINAAAYTAVDKAESEPDAAYAVNRDGPSYLAVVCAEKGIPLIYVSTDYVFDGTKDGPYREDDRINPINAYGRSKLKGEQAIRERMDDHIIVRTQWLFGPHGPNFVATILKLAQEQRSLDVVNDQWGSPT
jgi:dTDP-4-dehydrorhamnose reductase